MTKVNIISGFLGAGKTTLIKKLLDGAFKGEKVVLLENEYGEVGIDGGFMKDAGIEISELNSGCICCTLAGDFSDALKMLVETYNPDRIIIEPTGVGKLSDIRKVVEEAAQTLPLDVRPSATVADVTKVKVYSRNFGEFFNDQISSAETVILSRTQTASQKKIDEAVAMLHEKNERARIITTPWDELDAGKMLESIENPSFLLTLEEYYKEEEEHHHHHHDEDECECGCGHHHDHEHHHHHDDEECECGHEHHHHHDDEECECGHEHHHHHDDEECECGHEHHHHHDDDECECGHEHHHHHDDEECECGHEHHHHHDDDECECGCGHHHHHHHHGHDADEVFENIGVETPKKFDEEKIRAALEELDDSNAYGMILRAKGILPLNDGRWLHFDYVPGESEVRYGSADFTGRLCVIGVKINESAVRELFGL